VRVQLALAGKNQAEVVLQSTRDRVVQRQVHDPRGPRLFYLASLVGRAVDLRLCDLDRRLWLDNSAPACLAKLKGVSRRACRGNEKRQN